MPRSYLCEWLAKNLPPETSLTLDLLQNNAAALAGFAAHLCGGVCLLYCAPENTGGELWALNQASALLLDLDAPGPVGATWCEALAVADRTARLAVAGQQAGGPGAPRTLSLRRPADLTGEGSAALRLELWPLPGPSDQGSRFSIGLLAPMPVLAASPAGAPSRANEPPVGPSPAIGFLLAGTARDDVLANIAHDLRNPLNAILTSAALVRRKIDDRQAVGRGMDRIQQAIRRMDALLSDVLLSSRIEAGRLALVLQAHDLRGTVQAAVMVAAAAAATATSAISIQLDLPPVPVIVLGDAARLAQALGNLLHNARKFSGRAGQVQIRLQQEGDQVQLSVADSGIGISVADLPSLFRYVWQAPAARHRGLGLGIVRGIAEAHGGTVSVVSELGQGTTVTLCLRGVVSAVS